MEITFHQTVVLPPYLKEFLIAEYKVHGKSVEWSIADYALRFHRENSALCEFFSALRTLSCYKDFAKLFRKVDTKELAYSFWLEYRVRFGEPDIEDPKTDRARLDLITSYPTAAIIRPFANKIIHATTPPHATDRSN